MGTSYHRAFLTVACCSGYFVMGLVISLIGVGLNAFGEQLSVSPTEIGSGFFLAIGSATFIMLFAAGPLIDRFGQKCVLVAGSIFCGVSVLLLSRISSFASACWIMFLLGSGTAGLNAGANTLINHLYPQNPGRALNLVNIFFGLGAVSVPLLASWLFLSFGLIHLLILTAGFCFLPAILFASSGFPSETQMARFSLKEAALALSDPLVPLFALVLFFYVGLEASLGIWSRLAVVDKWKVHAPFDQIILAGFWASLVIGRLAAGTIFKYFPSHKLVLYCAVGSCIGLTGYLLGPSVEMASAALWFSGLCFAPIFPSTLGSVGTCFKRYTGTIFSLVIAMGVLGSVALSTAVGKLGGSSSLSNAFRLILAVAFLMLITQIMISRKVRKRL
ncbi:MAG TPA: MFS transporter [archaeon]|nr:MFS transporter [archaeon]